jgi:hypothetical protein
LDWAGDPFDASRFHLEHGEDSYEQFLRHYDEYDDVACDTPLNPQSTTLGLNAYALGAGKGSAAGFWITPMRGWTARGPMAAYSPARSAMMASGPDWWGGTYGWNFAPLVPQTGKREGRNRCPRDHGFLQRALADRGQGIFPCLAALNA